MELGPIQEAWVTRLEKYPERKMTRFLGKRQNDGTYKACCLGEAYLTLCDIKGIEPNWKDEYLIDGEVSALDSFKELGLFDSVGVIKNLVYTFNSLASMNDSGMSWTEIAKFIRENPEKVFSKSI